jgi:DNA-directed RNA polymerase specialized sigma24 family protein
VREAERERRRRFDQLFACYGSDIAAYCSWRAGSAPDAQDAAAEVFLTAWRRLDEVPGGDPWTRLAVRDRSPCDRQPTALETAP